MVCGYSHIHRRVNLERIRKNGFWQGETVHETATECMMRWDTNLASCHVAHRPMCLYGFQLFQTPFQLIQRLHGQPLSTLICHAHQRSFIRTIITYYDKVCMSLLCRLRPTRIIRLTISPPIPLSLYTLRYWSNRPFLIFDTRALWRSGLSARALECQKLKMVG